MKQKPIYRTMAMVLALGLTFGFSSSANTSFFKKLGNFLSDTVSKVGIDQDLVGRNIEGPASLMSNHTFAAVMTNTTTVEMMIEERLEQGTARNDRRRHVPPPNNGQASKGRSLRSK